MAQQGDAGASVWVPDAECVWAAADVESQTEDAADTTPPEYVLYLNYSYTYLCYVSECYSEASIGVPQSTALARHAS